MERSDVVYRLRTYKVIKHTAKGVFIHYGLSNRKFVLLTAIKKFAHPTIEDAKESFIARKNRQIKIHTAWVNRAKRAIYHTG